MAMDDLKSKLGKARDRIASSEVVASAKERVAGSETLAKAREKLIEAGRGMVDKGLTELEAIRPLLDRGGLDIKEVTVTASPAPGLGVFITPRPGVPITLADVLADTQLTPSQAALLHAVHLVSALDEVLDRHEHTIDRIHVELGAPPKVRAFLRTR